MKSKNILASILLSLSFSFLSAQQTGSFNVNINFNNQSRTLSCYVPNSYDSTQQYQLLIGLHGLGDNSTNYRNALINALSWSTHLPNTIFIFPDGGSDPAKDFHAPAGDENIILECINFGKQQYNIDSTDIILQGFSLGGRSALAFGLDNPQLFKGLLLNTPAVQGKLDALNLPFAGILYNYGNANQIPIFSTMGENDFFYVSNSERVASILKDNNGIFQDRILANTGHTMPGINYINEALDFFNNSTKDSIDVEVYRIANNNRYCSTNFIPAIMVRNVGSSTVNSLEIEYGTNSGTSIYNWSGSIMPFESKQITLPSFSGTNGRIDFEAKVLKVNAMVDSISFNNSASKLIVLDGSSATLPFTDDFEDDNALWTSGEDPSIFQWYYDETVALQGQQSIGAFNTIHVFPTQENVESFISPALNTNGLNQVMISYDIAYNYHKFTPPYTVMDTVFADTLEVLISTDCGLSYNSVFKAGGTDLATANNPIVNPLNITAGFMTPSTNDWRKDSIFVSLSNADNILVKFDYKSALGGSINIDNFKVEDANSISLQELEQRPAFSFYPNPAQSFIQIDFDKADLETMAIYDLKGTEVFRANIYQNSSLSIDISGLSEGMYVIEAQSKDEVYREKLLVKH